MRVAFFYNQERLPPSHPQTNPYGPLLAAAKQMQVEPARCIYLGDDERDMIAGRAAGMRVAVAEYGYLGLGNPPDLWPADLRIHDPREMLAAIT